MYEVNIDFDIASSKWKENKISVGNGCYIYKKKLEKCDKKVKIKKTETTETTVTETKYYNLRPRLLTYNYRV